MLQHKWAIWSGFLGATASCIGKIALTNNPLSPLQKFNEQICQPNLSVDLDSFILDHVYKILGDLMIHHRINLMVYWLPIRQRVESIILFFGIFEVDWCQCLMIGPRILCFVGMLIINAYMIVSFLKGMKLSGSVVGTALSSGSNFCLSALYGNILWNEQFNSTWWMGFATVMAGVVLLTTVTTNTDKKEENTKSATATTKSYETPTISNYRPRAERSSSSSSTISDFVPKRLPLDEYVSAAAATSPAPRTSTPLSRKALSSPKIVGPSKAFHKQKKQQTNSITDRFFINECPLCQETLFDTNTGESEVAIADLSPNCFHVMHAKCLIQQSTNVGNSKKSKCIVCEKPIHMWIRTKQSASLAAFWMERIEAILKSLGPPKNEKGQVQPLPVSVVREKLWDDPTLTDAQKKYIDDDPSGLGKGMESCLEWGGSIDYNKNSIKGRIGWNQCLVTKGVWSYDRQKDEIWLWEWGMHPNQRCDQCQFLKKPLPTECQNCIGSSEAAVYCSSSCQKRDSQRHKMTCQMWMTHGPK